MSIVWVRHGETDLNARRVVQPADTPLSARGREQAAAAAQRLRDLRPAALLSSDLARARQTADAVAAATGLPVVTDPALRERNFGTLRGRAWDSLDFEIASLVEAPEGGESMADFHTRVARAWQAVVARRAELPGPLVVVSHGLLIHAALLRHASCPPGLALPARLANASVSVVQAQAPHALLSVDDTGHLPQGPTDPA
jgi:2,3-bisphosphoglycerate-dependent phosphoglycerate mutase